ncbi:hypothetical protein TNCV_4224151 [Trichonephila clavipes]|nr:hypothetical protein TNCV_4224151 [Trichonephila clavipes]
MQGVWKLFVEQLLRLRLLVSLNESHCRVHACCTILRSSLLAVFLVAPDPVFRTWVPCPLLPTISNGKTPNDPPGQRTRRVDQPFYSFHPDDQASLKLA